MSLWRGSACPRNSLVKHSTPRLLDAVKSACFLAVLRSSARRVVHRSVRRHTVSVFKMAPDSQVFLPKARPLALDQLSTSDLQQLASAHGAKSAWKHDRSTVLSMVSNHTQRDSRAEYLVEDVKVAYASERFPRRVEPLDRHNMVPRLATK